MNCLGVTDNMARRVPVQFAVKRCLVRPTHNTHLIPVTLYNSAGHAIRLKSHDVIGVFSKTNENNLISLNSLGLKEENSVQHKFDVNDNLSPVDRRMVMDLLTSNNDMLSLIHI